MKVIIAKFFRGLILIFGTKIQDVNSGAYLGRAFIITWRGNIWIFGYSGKRPLVPVWHSEDNVKYWRSVLGFTSHDKTTW